MGWGMGRTGMSSTPASRSFCPFREKAVGLRPITRWGRKAPDPFSLAHHISDTTQPGQLQYLLLARPIALPSIVAYHYVAIIA